MQEKADSLRRGWRQTARALGAWAAACAIAAAMAAALASGPASEADPGALAWGWGGS